jgi:hypothetical protein
MPVDFTQLPDKRIGANMPELPDSQEKMLGEAYRQFPEPSSHYSSLDKLSKKTGIPEPVIARNKPKVEKIANEPDWESIPERTKKLMLSDIKLFKLAKDDYESLGALEKTYDTALAILGGGTQAVLGLGGQVVHRTPEAFATTAQYLSETVEGYTGLPAMINPLRALQYTGEYFALGRIPGTDIQTGGMSDIAEQVSEAQKILVENPDVYGETWQRLAEKGVQADEALTSALGGDLEPIAELGSDPEAWAGFIGNAAPSLYMAWKSGGSIPFIAWLEGMETATSAAEFEKQTGVKVSPGEFVQAFGQTALINSYLEKLGLDKILGAGKGTLSGFLKGALAEGGTEALQQFNANVAQWIAYNPEKELSEGVLASAMGGAGTGGPVGGITGFARKLSATPADTDVIKNAEQSIVAEQRVGAIDSLVENALVSELRQDDKASYNQSVEQILEGAQEFYLNSEDAAEFFQSNPDALDVVNANLPEVAKNVEESKSIGGDVIIPAKDYVTFLPEYHQELRDKIRVGADSMSNAEAQEWNNTYAQEFKENADKVLAQKQDDDSFEENANEVYQGIKEQIVATGRFTEDAADKYAKLHKTIAIAIADRVGTTPAEIYKTYGLEVLAPPPEAAPPPPPGEVEGVGAIFDETQYEQAVVQAEKEHAKKLRRVKVKYRETVLETGEEVEITETADKALERTTQRMESLKQMLECIRS